MRGRERGRMEKNQEAYEAPERDARHVVVVVYSERELILTRKLRNSKGALQVVAVSLM